MTALYRQSLSKFGAIRTHLWETGETLLATMLDRLSLKLYDSHISPSLPFPVIYTVGEKARNLA